MARNIYGYKSDMSEKKNAYMARSCYRPALSVDVGSTDMGEVEATQKLHLRFKMLAGVYGKPKIALGKDRQTI